MNDDAATITTAASVAVGRKAVTRGVATKIRRTSSAATTPLSWVRAPASSTR